MIARALMNKGGRAIGIRIGGFNLLPYRQTVARERRRRLVIESVAAVLVGALAAVAWTAFDTVRQSGQTAQRAALERALAGFATPLAEYRRLEAASARAQGHAEVATDLARPRALLLETFEALGRTPSSGVVLHRIKMSEGGLELFASAADNASSAAWIDQLARARGVRIAEITDWRLAAKGAPHETEVTARVMWDEPIAVGAPSEGPKVGRIRR
jgi:Tfp pilus assembly protein PilN